MSALEARADSGEYSHEGFEAALVLEGRSICGWVTEFVQMDDSRSGLTASPVIDPLHRALDLSLISTGGLLKWDERSNESARRACSKDGHYCTR